jgi:hypothetical protein
MGEEGCAELSARLPDPPLTLPPAVAGPVQGELQLHVSQLVLEEAAGAADDQEYQVCDCSITSACCMRTALVV